MCYLKFIFFVIYSKKVSQYLDRHHKICENLDECLMDVTKNRSKAVAISREHAKNTRLPIAEDDFYCFPPTNNIFVYSIVIIAKKDFHLLSKFNELIRRISESGLLSKWHREENKEENKAQNTHKNIQMKLKIVHVEGAFFLCGIGLLAASFAFIVEKITFYVFFKKNVKKHNIKLLSKNQHHKTNLNLKRIHIKSIKPIFNGKPITFNL